MSATMLNEETSNIWMVVKQRIHQWQNSMTLSTVRNRKGGGWSRRAGAGGSIDETSWAPGMQRKGSEPGHKRFNFEAEERRRKQKAAILMRGGRETPKRAAFDWNHSPAMCSRPYKLRLGLPGENRKNIKFCENETIWRVAYGHFHWERHHNEEEDE